ncbi:hypothetical protein C0214_13935 [Methylobacterium sp. DM1]|nr:hypothetical protein C0214_13935 [Methylobacterium sp. DM1]
MFGNKVVQYGRPLRARQEAWIYRRSIRLVPLLLRVKAKSGRTSVGSARAGDNDNTVRQPAPTLHERRGWEQSLATK